MQVSQSSGQYVLSYQGRYYPFNKDQIVIGSDPRCDIPIENNPRVLPAHAWLTLQDGKVFLQHQNSSAAIWVNGMRVTEVQLQDRAEIAVGDTETRLMLLLNRTPIGPVGDTVAQVSANMGGMQVAKPVGSILPQTGPFPSSDPMSQLNESTNSFVPQSPQAPQAPVISTRERSSEATGSPMSVLSESTASFIPQTPQAPQAPVIPVGGQLSSPPVVPMGTISRELNISKIHAFAGYGVQVTHQSWFFGGKAAVAGNMLTTSFDILQRRSILGLTVGPRNLQDYGDWNEMRHYLILRRGISTVFLYIAPAGHDLYISRATTVLTSIDSFRRFLLIALVVLGVLLFIVFPISIPIWLFLIFFFVISFRYWLRERDFWFYLRKKELNDFQMDDIALIEQVTDDTLRVAAKHNEIDADKLVPPQKGYQPARRVRGV